MLRKTTNNSFTVYIYFDYLYNNRTPVFFTLQNLAPVDFSRNPHFEQKFRFYDQSLYDAVLAGNPDVSIFFRHLALCHTVMADERAGKAHQFYMY